MKHACILRDGFMLVVFIALTNLSVQGQGLTVGEVFDFREGDEMGVVIQKEFGPLGYRYMRVTKRQDYGRDSMKVTFNQITYTYNFQLRLMAKLHTRPEWTYYHLDSPYFKGFTKQDTVVYWNSGDSSMSWIVREFKDSMYTDSCFTPVNMRLDNVSTPLSGGDHMTITAWKGLGVLERSSSYDGANGTSLDERFIYYIKGGKLCGNKNAFPVSVTPVLNEPSRIYPNPAKGYLHIDQEGPFRIILSNSLGQVVLDRDHLMSGVDVSGLSKGLYTVELYANETCYRTKLLIE